MVLFFQGGNMEVYSFTSSKTSEIKKEEIKEDKKTKEEQTFFQKFISLLQIYLINNVNNSFNIG